MWCISRSQHYASSASSSSLPDVSELESIAQAAQARTSDSGPSAVDASPQNRVSAARTPPSLLDLCLDSLARLPVDELNDVVNNQLGHYLANELLDAIRRTGRLGLQQLTCFAHAPIYRLDLSRLPAVTWEWLASIESRTLQVVDCSSTKVNDSVFSTLAAQPKLHTLILSHTLVSGQGLEQLAALPNLGRLDLVGCKCLQAVCAGFHAFTSLLNLSLRHCRKVCPVEVMLSLAHCSNLQSLNLAWCQAPAPHLPTSAHPAVVFLHLTSLDLTWANVPACHLCSLWYAPQCSSLRLGACDVGTPDLQEPWNSNHMDDIPLSRIARLAALSTLQLQWATALPPDWLHLKHLTRTVHLDLSFSNVPRDAVCFLLSMTFLTYLNLDSTPIAGSTCQLLSKLVGLHELNLADTKVENSAVEQFTTLTRLVSLDLSYTLCTDQALASVARLTRLTYLNVDSRLITDTGLWHLSPLTNLQALDLFGCKFSKRAAGLITKLQNLVWLEADGGHVCNDLVAALSSLTQLSHLSIAQNPYVTDASWEALHALQNLRSLNISGTSMRIPHPDTVRALPSLRRLAVYNLHGDADDVRRLFMGAPGVTVMGVRSGTVHSGF